MAKVLIVGSGLTGSIVKHFISMYISELIPQQSLGSITMWESARVSGGRMQNDFYVGSHRCDLGAQYISKNISEKIGDLSIYEFIGANVPFGLIRDNNLIRGMRSEHVSGQHYVASTGTSYLTSTLSSGSDILFKNKLTRLSLDKNSNKLVAFTTDANTDQSFDAIVLTMPTPQLSQVLTSDLVSTSLIHQLQRVRYSSRYSAWSFECPSSPIADFLC